MKKIVRGDKHDNTKIFKPRRMVVGGIVYDIDSIETLDKIKSEHAKKKIKDQEILEQEKQQKVLIKRTRSGNTDEKIVKIITDLNKTPDMKKPKHNAVKKIHEEKAKPKFKLTSLACKRKIEVPQKKNTQPPQDTISKSEKTHEENESKDTTIIKPTIKPTPTIINDKPKTLAIKRANQNKIKTLQSNKPQTDVIEPIQIQNSIVLQETVQIENIEGLITKQYQVGKLQWYLISFKANKNQQGLIKIFDDNKIQIVPLIKIYNDMFVCKTYPDNSNEYRIYFKTLDNSNNIDVYVLGLILDDIKVQTVTSDIVSKAIDLWKFRKLYDLEFINYYLSNVKLEINDKFVDRIKSEYELLKNGNYFDEFINNLNFDTKSIVPQTTEKTTILYLLYSSIEYENYGYTIRTHYLLKNINDAKYNVYGVTRYGYPFDREQGYSDGVPGERYVEDNVEYIKLLDKTDNFNTNNIIDYIKKYILSVIKLALENNAVILHAATNYWNGIAALYAAKYLKIKSIYEVRVLWEDTSTVSKPELKGSDLLKMIQVQEKKIFDEADKIITINNSLKDRLIINGVDGDKIEVVYNGVDTNTFSPNSSSRENLRVKHNIQNEDIVIGYIGTLSNYEGLNYILECMKQLIEESYQIKFLVIGDGPYKNDMMNLITQYKLENEVICLNKMKHSKVFEYYNMIDIIIYPKKKCDLCNSTSGNKILEAMSMGKPIIASELEAFKEIITDGENGILCEPDNLNDLISKTKLLIQDDELRTKIGENARNWVVTNRQWTDSAEKMKAIYNSFLH
jgi:glycosyltransferase involved in cell wall biosynthesis